MAEIADPVIAGEHVLLTVLGTSHEPARYTLEDRWAEAQFAPLALLELLPEAERPDRVLAICTSKAKEVSLPLLREQLPEGLAVQPISIGDGQGQEDIARFLAQVVAEIPRQGNLDLTVDVTHGFRHLSFLTYVAVLYLSALRGVHIRGAYYGMLQREAPSPFLDLRPLLELPRWVHALQVLAETGSAIPMARILSGEIDGKVGARLRWISESYLSALPLELGRYTREFRDDSLKPLRRHLEKEHQLPLAAELVSNLSELLEPFVLEQYQGGDGWKKRVNLTRGELERQARLIDDLLRRESIANALGLMNEWTVSWVTLCLGRESGWLEFQKVRRRASNLLSTYSAAKKDPELCLLLSSEQVELGSFWEALTDVRNAFHHHGIRRQPVVGDKEVDKKLDVVKNYWEKTLRGCPDLPMTFSTETAHRILLSPIGNRPGVLFSAIQTCRGAGGDPTMCLVLCSEQSAAGIEEACTRAGYEGAVELLRLEDPYGGLAETDRIVKAARPWFLGASDLLVNITGGTTLMGLVAERLASEARNLATPVRRFGLIDRRSLEAQVADPYQAGEPIWLDSFEGDSGRP